MKRLILILAPAALFLASCKSGNIKEPEYREIRDVRIMEVGYYRQQRVWILFIITPTILAFSWHMQAAMSILMICFLVASVYRIK